jgi:hypothetical protein
MTELRFEAEASDWANAFGVVRVRQRQKVLRNSGFICKGIFLTYGICTTVGDESEGLLRSKMNAGELVFPRKRFLGMLVRTTICAPGVLFVKQPGSFRPLGHFIVFMLLEMLFHSVSLGLQ